MVLFIFCIFVGLLCRVVISLGSWLVVVLFDVL